MVHGAFVSSLFLFHRLPDTSFEKAAVFQNKKSESMFYLQCVQLFMCELSSDIRFRTIISLPGLSAFLCVSFVDNSIMW